MALCHGELHKDPYLLPALEVVHFFFYTNSALKKGKNSIMAAVTFPKQEKMSKFYAPIVTFG